MKGTDVTPEQLARADGFLRAAQGDQIGPRGERLYTDLAQLSLSRGNLIRLLAWYGAIRAKSGRETPNPLVHRTGPGSTMDFGTPEQLAEMPDSRWPCGGWRGSQNRKATDPACSGVEAESVAVGQAERAALHIHPDDTTDDPCIGDDRERIIYKDGTAPAELLQGDEDMPEVNCGTFTAATIRRQHALICKLRGQLGQANQSLDTANAALNVYGNQVQARDAVIVELNAIIERSLGKELSALRLAQDLAHGGPEHDDTHTPSDWRVFIQQYNQVAEEYASEPEIRESKLLAVAGLAVAAIQSSRRKRA